VDSAGETINFMLSPKRDLIAAKLFLRLELSGGVPSPRMINVDEHPAYASAIRFETVPGKQLHQKAHCRQFWLSVGGGMEDERRIRSEASDPKRAEPLAVEEGCDPSYWLRFRWFRSPRTPQMSGRHCGPIISWAEHPAMLSAPLFRGARVEAHPAARRPLV